MWWLTRNPGWTRRSFQALAEASSVASLLIAAAPAALAAGGAIAALVLGHRVIAAFLGGAMAMFVLAAGALAFPMRPVVRKLIYGWFFAKVVVALQLDGDGPGRHVRSVRYGIRIVRTGERWILDRYCQPAPRRGDPAPPSHAPVLVEGDGSIVDIGWDAVTEHWVFHVGFPKQQSGADLAFRTKQSLDYRELPYPPMLQRTIVDPTDFLSLRLRCPESTWPLAAHGEEEVRVGGRTKRLPVKVDDERREIRLDVRSPRPGSVYRIRWTPVASASANVAEAMAAGFVGVAE